MEAPAGSMAFEPTYSQIRRRLFVRRDSEVMPFFWRGLLPLLGLLGVTAYGISPFARQSIEAKVLHEVRAALDAQGMQWAQVSVTGQNVWLSGQLPASGVGDSALAAARQATCGT